MNEAEHRDVPRLSEATLAGLPPAARTVADRRELRPRIAHLGIGAFHRAHQAVYTEDANGATGGDWGIVAVAPSSARVVDALRAQDHRYTVTTKAPDGPSVRVVGSIVGSRHLPTERDAVLDLLADAGTAVVTLTVTEKAYLRTPDGGLDAAAVADELASGEPASVVGVLAHALAARARTHGAPVSVVSCDNMAGNGPAVRRVVTEYVEAAGWQDAPAVRAWIADSVTFPATIVDRIVPATTPEDLDAVERELGVRDEAGVVGEPYLQWVIEDDFAGPRPPWDAAGALFVPDVAPYQLTKLRLLNGAHSLLAYLGLASGCELVAEAMATPWGEDVVLGLAREVAPVLPAGGPGPEAYARDLVERFRNPAMRHRLTQIGSDGSLKLPERWLGSLRELRALGLTSPTIVRGLGAWVAAIRPPAGGVADGGGGQVWGTTDPRAATLAAAWASGGGAGERDGGAGDGGHGRDGEGARGDLRSVVVAALLVLGAEDLAADTEVVDGVTDALRDVLTPS